MNVLYIGAVKSQLSANLAEKLNKNTNVRIDAIFQREKDNKPSIFEQKYNAVYYYNSSFSWHIPKLNGIINTVRLLFCLFRIKKVDIIHLQYISREMYFLLPLIKAKSRSLVITVWGSEIGDSKKPSQLLIKIFNAADSITCSNNDYKAIIINLLKCNNNKVQIISDNLNVLDDIDALKYLTKEEIKRELGIPDNHLVICCGTNARKMQNHLSIIEEINKIYHLLNQSIYLLFPMSYGDHDSQYMNQLEMKLNEYNLKHKILLDFMPEREVAKLRIISDILIQVQEHDQLSAAMLETLYARNLLITGSWLPYVVLEENDIFYFKIDKLEDLHTKVISCVNYYKDNFALTIENMQKVEKLIERTRIVQIWNDYYQGLCN